MIEAVLPAGGGLASAAKAAHIAAVLMDGLKAVPFKAVDAPGLKAVPSCRVAAPSAYARSLRVSAFRESGVFALSIRWGMRGWSMSAAQTAAARESATAIHRTTR